MRDKDDVPALRLDQSDEAIANALHVAREVRVSGYRASRGQRYPDRRIAMALKDFEGAGVDLWRVSGARDG